jgi:hypothetical protein
VALASSSTSPAAVLSWMVRSPMSAASRVPATPPSRPSNGLGLGRGTGLESVPATPDPYAGAQAEAPDSGTPRRPPANRRGRASFYYEATRRSEGALIGGAAFMPKRPHARRWHRTGIQRLSWRLSDARGALEHTIPRGVMRLMVSRGTPGYLKSSRQSSGEGRCRQGKLVI